MSKTQISFYGPAYYYYSKMHKRWRAWGGTYNPVLHARSEIRWFDAVPEGWEDNSDSEHKRLLAEEKARREAAESEE